MVGAEGLIGASALLGGTTVGPVYRHADCQGRRCASQRARAKPCSTRTPRCARVILRFVEDILNLSAQTAACNRLHSVEQRCARWLLMASDRVQSRVLSLTQEFLAAMIGVRRSGVSEAASELQRSGVIRYRRGEITIIDPTGCRRSPANAIRSIGSGSSGCCSYGFL